MIRTPLTALLVAGVAVAAPASVFGAPAHRTAVAYADLDLSKPADVARLRRRIAAALDEVCGSYAAAESADDYGISRCRAAARAGAERQLASILGGSVQVAGVETLRGPR